MITHRIHSVLRPVAGLGACLTVLSVSCFAVPSADARSREDGCSGAYSWPVKPFDRPHQVRGAFGDPRTQFQGPPTRETLLGGSGKFLFHEGADITAPDGSPVYAVADGRVSRVAKEWVAVDCGTGRSFEYWHLDARVRAGQQVTAGRTVLGHVKRGEAHVHLTELDRGHPVNPLAPGHLGPYRDTTTPRVVAISLKRSERGADELPQLVRGSVYLLAEAVDYAEPIDTPGLRTPSVYRGWPVTPARITSRIERWTGSVAVAERTARDVRASLPDDARFWQTFARGTHQNQTVFGSHYSYLQTGRYVFKLAPRPFDTRTLRDGVYELVVTASDGAGHRDVERLRFTVGNHLSAP